MNRVKDALGTLLLGILFGVQYILISAFLLSMWLMLHLLIGVIDVWEGTKRIFVRFYQWLKTMNFAKPDK